MNWFRQNRALGIIVVLTAVAALGSLVFLFIARSGWTEASERLGHATAELDRLQRLSPFPNSENLRKMKAHADDYTASVGKLKEELKARVLPVTPLAPNEFQARLRATVTAVAERARATKTKLPDNFFLGFDSFAAALPNTAAAPLLGQQLSQIEMLMDMMIDAHVDAVNQFRRMPLPEESGAGAAAATAGTKLPKENAAGAKLVERSVVNLTFTSTPAAARRVLNSMAAAEHQFFIIRLLQVRNQKDKGPAREGVGDLPANGSGAVGSPSTTNPAAPAKTAVPGLNFIVGNEHIETSAKIEIVRFGF